MNVYVIEQGNLYEGGTVRGVFVTEELAREQFNYMLREERASAKEMYEWILNDIEKVSHSFPYGVDADYRKKEADKWLTETVETEEMGETYIFHGSRFISLTQWEAP